jgi:protein-tyrosine phosphatase
MIDLHSHILPGVDDGAPDLNTSLEMARIAVADGITHMACTPHIVAGVYDNSARTISDAVAMLQRHLREAQIPLELFVGADAHIAPDLPERLTSGDVPTLNKSRYFLLEPTHHILPPRIEELASRLIKAGFIPILTHPERLTWIVSHYTVIERLNDAGCLIQLTAGSIEGAFGRMALYYAERLIDEGRVDIVASDAHGADTRQPCLSRARTSLAARIGEEEAEKMVLQRPYEVLFNQSVEPAAASTLRRKAGERPLARRFGALGRIFGGGGS